MTQAQAKIEAAKPREVRIEGLASAGAAPSSPQFVPHRSGYRKAPVTTVPEDLLLYRVENGRLITQLEEHARKSGTDIAQLRAREETAEVQQLLHELLLREATSEEGPIFQELERQGQQTEPLLVTRDGVVVNGNRRLASMRELRARDAARYAGFEQVGVAVLPEEFAAGELEYLEAALQMAPETKLAYGWINRRLKLRRQRNELGLPLAALLESYRIPDSAAIEREIAELELAERYLADYCGEPEHYSLLADLEELFVGLNAQLAELAPELREPWQAAGFAMISGRGEVRGPMDRHFPFAAPGMPRLPAFALRRFAEEAGLMERGGVERADIPPEERSRLIELFSDRSKAGELAPELSAILEQAREELHEHRTPQRMLRQFAGVRDMLGALDPERLNDRQREQLRRELDAVQSLGAYLLGETQEKPQTRRPTLKRLRRLLRVE